MKTKSVFKKLLAMVLTAALLATSMLEVSLTASADGSTVINGNTFITFEDGTSPTGVTLDTGGSASVTASPVDGHGNYSLKHVWTSANRTILRTNVNFLAGHTYQISLYYYYEAQGEEISYSPWFNLYASGTPIIKGVYNAKYDQWFSYTCTYTPNEDKTYMDIIAGTVNAYFDDIIIRDITYQNQKQDSLYVATEFANVDTDTTAVVIAGGEKASVTYKYDAELGKNVAAVSFPASNASTSSMLCFPYLLKAGTTYSLSLTYKSDVWSCLSYNGKYDGSKPFAAKNKYDTVTRTFTPSADRCLYIGTTNPNPAVNMFISKVVLNEVVENTNTADRQVYDFDFTSPSAGGTNYSTALMKDANGQMSHVMSINTKDTKFQLDYALSQNKIYHIAFDYQGKANVRVLPFINGWNDIFSGNVAYSKNKDIPLASADGDWSHYSSYFLAESNATKIWVYAVNLVGNFYVDNFVIETVQEDQAVDFTENFELGTAFEGGATVENSSYSVVEAPGLDDEHGNYSLKHAKDNKIVEYYFMKPVLLKDHTYYAYFDCVADTNVSAAQNYYFNLTLTLGSQKTSLGGDNAGASWKKRGFTFKVSEEKAYLCLTAYDEIYFDNFRIIDITDMIEKSDDYYEDFSNSSEATLLQTSGSTVTYTEDVELNQKVATINFEGTSNAKFGWVEVPYYMENGVNYRIQINYQSDVWIAPHYNGSVQVGSGLKASSNWMTREWYVTANSNTDTISFGTNASSGTFKIQSIKISRIKMVVGDIDSNEILESADLILLMKYLLGISDPQIHYVSACDVKQDGSVDIRDLIRLKKLIAPVTLVDQATSLTSVANHTQNVAVGTDRADLLGDASSFRIAETGQEAFIIYRLDGGITEAAVEYDMVNSFMGDFSFAVSSNGSDWTKVTAQNIAKEEINQNSWIRVTEYFGDLSWASYFRIDFPATEPQSSVACHVRTVQINGLNAEALYAMNGYNSSLRAPQTIYVSNHGDDANTGLSQSAPLQTLEAAFERALVPGDEILLACGDTFEGEVKVVASGTQEDPIVISSYGTGEKPVISGFSKTGVKVTGEYVEIHNLAFTSQSGHSAIDFYALKDAQKYGANCGVSVNDCDFYEINSDLTSTDIARTSGGVHFMAQGNKPSWFDGVTVENNTFDAVARNAIYTSTNWAARDTAQLWGRKNFNIEGSPVFLSENIVIRGNEISNIGGDAITIIGTNGALIEHNTVANSALRYNNQTKTENNGNIATSNIAWASIWCHSSDNCVMQYNEVYGNRADNNGQDLQAFDIDHSCNDCIVQYNYSHNNAGGFMLLCGADSANNGGISGNIVRYNLSVNDGDAGSQVFDITGSVANTKIYNNTVYCGNNNVRLVNFANYGKATVKSSGTYFANNIFYAADGVSVSWDYGDSVTTPALQNAVFDHNVFYNISAPVYDNLISVTNSRTDNPNFANAGTVTNGLSCGTAYSINNTEMLTGGIAIANNGGKDYFGNAVSNTLMGAIA